MDHERFLKLAIEQAEKSVTQGGFPAGAVVVLDGKVTSEGVSIGFSLQDPTGHAEIAAIREACKKLGTADLAGATLYESVECCSMCFSACYWAGISKIVYAAKKTPEMVSKGYYEGNTNNEALNKVNNRLMEVVHASEFEKESLAIIEQWEKKGGFNS